MPPLGSFLRMHVQANLGAAVQLLQRDAHNARERVGIDLRFAVQNFPRNGPAPLPNFGFDSLVVILPFQSKLPQSLDDLLAIFHQPGLEFGARLLLPALPPLLEGGGLSQADLFTIDCAGNWAGIGGRACTLARSFDLGIGKEGRLGNPWRLRGTRRHTLPATRRLTLFSLRFRAGGPRPRFRAAPHGRLWRAPLPGSPCPL